MPAAATAWATESRSCSASARLLFHYHALNALGCSVVPLNPDYRREEIQHVIEHSEACVAVSIIKYRLDDMRTVCGSVDPRVPVVALADFLEPLWHCNGMPDGTTEAAVLYSSGATERPKAAS